MVTSKQDIQDIDLKLTYRGQIERVLHIEELDGNFRLLAQAISYLLQLTQALQKTQEPREEKATVGFTDGEIEVKSEEMQIKAHLFKYTDGELYYYDSENKRFKRIEKL